LQLAIAQLIANAYQWHDGDSKSCD
jgi:hypothetical protein